MATKTKTLIFMLSLTIALFGITTGVPAGEKLSDNMQILREKIKADKKLFVAENMQLTETEAKAFWPVYDSFQKDMDKLNDRLLALLEDYSQNYKTMTDEVAEGMIKESLSIESDRVELLKECAPKFVKAVGNIKAARYLQLENKINASARFDLARKIPLVK